MKSPFFFAASALLVGCLPKKTSSDTLAANSMQKNLLPQFSCDYTATPKRFYAASASHPLGTSPRTVELPDTSQPGVTHPNSVPEDADLFVRGASGVQFDFVSSKTAPVSVTIAQDSRRKLARVELSTTAADLGSDKDFSSLKLTMEPTSSKADLKNLEDDTIDYISARKQFKVDLESMTTLPDGTLLFVGSGSDILKKLAGKPGYRSGMVLFNRATRKVTELDALSFFKNLQQRREVIGADTADGKAFVNLEGVFVRNNDAKDPQIVFMNRGNSNGNGHNSAVVFSLDAFLKALEKNAAGDAASFATLEPLQVVPLNFGPILTSFRNDKTHVTLNDAIYGKWNGKETILIPISAEAGEYTDDKGFHHDGVVVFSAIARWTFDSTTKFNRCDVFHAPGENKPGEPSQFGKIEGLAALNLAGKTVFEQSILSDDSIVAAVFDADSEVSPAQLRFLKPASLRAE